ncbi:MAG TPA: redoxin domain-containing protein, partial [Candidatus Omnitrophota bacterium]|nr:redoxin domain-containing protein [Candidatus Omnitrophota bacterium]
LTGLEPGFLLRAEDAYSGIRKGNAELVVIAPVKQEEVEAFYKKNRLTFFILADEKREVFSKFISFEKDEPFSALFITDKYGEVFFHHIEKDVKELPPFEDIFKSLDFVESQCPECSGGI